MSRRKYAIIFILAIAALLCMVGASTWIITTPTKVTPGWQEGIIPVYVKRVAEADYTEGGITLDSITNQLTFCDEAGEGVENCARSISISTGGNSVTTANNGDLPEITNGKITVGSTYRVDNISIQLNAGYRLVGTYTADAAKPFIKDTETHFRGEGESYRLDDVLFKYKTVQIGSTWYTIEDALNNATSGNTAIVKGNTSFAGTTVAEIAGYTKNYTVQSGATLLVPRSASDTAGDAVSSDSDAKGLFATLTIPPAITVNVKGIVNVNATRDMNGATKSAYAQLEVKKNAQVIFESGSQFSSRGFTFGDGLITAKNGSKVREPFGLIGWKGGSVTQGIKDDIFPISQYTIPSIICKTKFEYGSAYLLYAHVEAAGATIDKEATFLGTSDGFMRLTDAASYAYKWIDEKSAHGEIHFEIHGATTFNNMAVTVEGYDLTTANKEIPIPGNFSITVAEGTTTVPSEIALKLLPGATLNVGTENTVAELDIAGRAYSYGGHGVSMRGPKGEIISTFAEGNPVSSGKKSYPCATGTHRIKVTNDYDAKSPAVFLINKNSKVTVTGTFACEVSGQENAVLDISNSNAKIDGSVREDYTTYGSGFAGRFTDGEYFTTSIISYTIDGDLSAHQIQTNTTFTYLNEAWRVKENPTVTYDANGGSFADGKGILEKSYSSLNDWQSKEVRLTQDLISDVESPTRSYYEFVGWATSETATEADIIKEGISITVGDTNTLYAVWTPIRYTVHYVIEDYDYTLNTDGLTEWSIEDDPLDLSTLRPEGLPENVVFVGWYNDRDFSEQITSLDSERIKHLTPFGKDITLYGQVNESKSYTVKYDYSLKPTDDGDHYAVGLTDTIEDPNKYSTGSTVNEKYVAALYTAEQKNDEDPNRKYYFLGWFDEKDNSVGADATIQDTLNGNNDSEIILTAKWAEKAHVTITDEEFGSVTRHYKHGKTLTVNEAVGEETLKAWHGKDYNVEVQTYFTENWSSVDVTIREGGTFTIPDGDGTNIAIKSERAQKVTLTVEYSAQGKPGTNDAWPWNWKDGADVTLSVTITGIADDGTETHKDGRQLTGKGGKGGSSVTGHDNSGKVDPDSVIAYLKPGQNYKITYAGSTNATIKVDPTTGATGTAGTEPITVTITAT